MKHILFSYGSTLLVMWRSSRESFGTVSGYYYPLISPFLIFQFKDFLILPVRFLPYRILSSSRMGRQVFRRGLMYCCNEIQKSKFYFSLISSDWTLLILFSFSDKTTTFIWKKRWKPSVLPWPSALLPKTLWQRTFFMTLLFIPLGVRRMCLVHLMSLGKFLLKA